MKKYMAELSASMDKMDGFYNLAKTFRHSAGVLYAYSADRGLLTREVYDNNLVPTLYLFRHAIELMLKALLEEMDCFDEKDYHHGFRELMNKCINADYLNKEKIQRSFNFLEKKFPGVLDDQLYRYPITKKGKELQDQKPIETECIEEFIHLYNCICDAVENIQGTKK